MLRLFFALIILSISYPTFSQDFQYEISMPDPHTHYFEVEWTIENWKNNTLEAKMPVWAPGSYLVREFSKSVDQFKATSSEGKELSFNKTTKNTWEVNTKGVKKLTITYRVYAFELSVRTSFIDTDHGYINGTSIFFYAEGFKDKGGKLKIIPYKKWGKVATSLPHLSDFTYRFNNYDHLADCPIEIGNHEEFTFEAAGITHRVAMFGEGNYEISTLQKDMAAIVEGLTKIFDENPNEDYLFIIHNLTVGSGGLEHMNSTTLQVNRWTYEGSDYLGFLSLVAHEYFHLWNVKRIRPEALGPFDYDNENYTTMLWVMEGFTSYYDKLILQREGFYSDEEYINKIFSSMNYVENLPGNQVQSLSESSFDAWIKAYRPNENSKNTTISYYSKGSLVAALIDMKIISASKGKKNLDDLMKDLYNDFYKKKNRGFSDDEFVKALSKYMKDAPEFVTKYVNGVNPLPYKEVLSEVGIELTENKFTVDELGVSISDNEVKNVARNSPAYEGGINVNDEIISINGWRVNSRNINDLVKKLQNEEVNVWVSRDSKMRELKVKLFPVQKVSYKYYLKDENKN